MWAAGLGLAQSAGGESSDDLHPSCWPDVTKRACSQLRRDTYTRLTPVQRLQVARHPNRPTFLDIALNISDKFVELHGDRAGLDDPAMVCGLASMDGISFMFVGHQKGRNTKARALHSLLLKPSVLSPLLPCLQNPSTQRGAAGPTASRGLRWNSSCMDSGTRSDGPRGEKAGRGQVQCP